MTQYRPRRSVLYMPGANDKALEKAKSLPTDAIIFDTEDSVSPDMKEVAREKVAAAATSGEYGRRELTIRVNSIETEWFEADVRSAAAAGPSGIVVPKVNSAADVATIERLLESAGAPDHTMIWAMLETPAAVENAVEIATSSERLAVLVMGTNDLAKELRAALLPGRHPLLWGLARCVNAARHAGKVILDGVYNDVRDPDGFAAECRQGAEMGFDGKTLIHPTQVEPCNEAFAPSPEEVEYSRRVIEAFEAGLAEGKGVVTVDGRMIENLHVDNARRALAIDEAIRALSADASNQ
ncbi:MAG TPA: CoA ester lyase [Microthrixaceae bacterium]|nr:CoA ester lyase [Microthrixaceae bacterium]